MALKYKIERKERTGEVRFQATPNEWATEANATVVIEDRFGEKEVPRVEQIGWSAGARKWTIEDARTFFHACLKMLDAAEAELEKAKAGSANHDH